MRTAGIILDIYDDPKARVLREKLAGRPLPEKLASSRLLDPEDLAQMPDRLFGLVAVNNGNVLRKYAMHDESHLATSILYFMECGHVLPEEVQSKVASNLVNACAWYDMDPPEPLVKRALLGGALAGLSTVTTMTEGRKRMKQDTAAFRRAQHSGEKVASGRWIELSLEEDRRIQNSTGEPTTDTTPGHIMSAAAQFSQYGPTKKKLLRQIDTVESEKKSDLNNTEIMPRGVMKHHPVRNSTAKRVALPGKTAAAKVAASSIPAGWLPAGDLTSAEPPVRVKQANHKKFALHGKYPIDTPDLVKRAAAYFDMHLTEFGLRDRRDFAQAVVQQASELGMKVAGAVLDYAGDGYGPYIDAELEARRSRFEGTGHDAVYEMLQEKKAELTPEVMAEMLLEADVETGAVRSYGRPGTGLMDPYRAVYGDAKLAAEEAELKEEDTFSWKSDSGEYVTGHMLVALAEHSRGLDGLFGKDFAEDYRKDPIGIFKSLPDPQKVLLARLASDNSSGATFRI